MLVKFIQGALTELFSGDYKKIPWLKLKVRILTSKILSPLRERTAEDYLSMQRRQYDAAAKVASVRSGVLIGDCVAVVKWELHDSFPDYRKYLFAGLGDTQSLTALEYGCGPGRNLLNWWPQFHRIDGVDISSGNLNNAKKLLSSVIPKDRFPYLYLTNGANTGDAPSNTYHFCFSVICLQHIAVWATRQSILVDLYRVLKMNGILGVQMATIVRPGVKLQTVSYRENRFNAGVTNGGCDVRIDDPEEMVADLKAIGFKEIKYTIAPVPEDISGVFENFIYFTAIK